MDNQRNILFVSCFGSLKGGGQRSLFLLLERLNRGRYKPFLICPEEGSLTESAKKIDIDTEVIEIPHLRIFNCVRIIRTLLKIRIYLIKKRIDLIHTDSPLATVYYGLAGRFLRIPVIFHARVSNAETRFYERFLYNLSTKIIAVSEKTKIRFNNFSDTQHKVSTIYNAVDINKFYPVIEMNQFREEIMAGNRIIIGLIGEISSGKGHNEFFLAVDMIVKKFKDVIFLIIGAGETGYVEQMINMINQSRNREYFKVFPFRDDILKIMNGIDILVNASRMEGFSRVILEAMACGKPVIATNVGGNPEAVDDGITGILVPVQNPERMSEAILKLCLNSDLRNKMGIAGRRKVEESFSIEKNVRKIEALYDQVLSAGRIKNRGM